MRSGTCRAVSKCSRHKDRYIGRLYLDIGMVPGEIGNIPEHREVTGTPWEVYGPYWALVEKRGKARGAPPPFPCPIRTQGEGSHGPALAGPSLSPLGQGFQ